MSAVHAAVASRFCAPEWATFFEVSNAAGYNRTRSADAVAMNLWPSRGLAVHGVEIKLTRSDWLRELRDPAKSEPIQKYCDRWWVAVADDSVAQPEELPATWGLLVLRGKKLVQVKEAPVLKPEPLTRGFIAALLRRASEGMVHEARVAELVEEKIEQRAASRQHRVDGELRETRAKLAALEKQVAEFEMASGVRIHESWSYHVDAARVGAAVRAILGGSALEGVGTLERARNVARAFVRESEAMIEALRALQGSGP